MASINEVNLLGNLGADPELKYTPSNRAVANLRLATAERYKDKQGEWQEKTEWHKIVVWGKQAESCDKYLGKGKQVFVQGKLTTRSWDKDGQKHYSTEIVARNVVFLGGGGGGGGGGSQQGQSQEQSQAGFYDEPPF